MIGRQSHFLADMTRRGRLAPGGAGAGGGTRVGKGLGRVQSNLGAERGGQGEAVEPVKGGAEALSGIQAEIAGDEGGVSLQSLALSDLACEDSALVVIQHFDKHVDHVSWVAVG